MKALVALIAGLLICGSVAANDRAERGSVASTDPDPLSTARERLRDLPGSDALFDACPADIWRTRRTLAAMIAGPIESEDACAADREDCLSACIDRGDGTACLYIGFELEYRGADADDSGRRFHALACALGEPSGCTNRGGGIRNYPMPTDLQSNIDEAERFDCLHRTFRDACASDDPWACAMSGQAFALGEGTRSDPRIARRLFDKACMLSGNPEFGACVFANEQREMLADRPSVGASRDELPQD